MAHNVTFRGQGNSGTALALQLIETTAQITYCTFSSNRYGHTRLFSVYYGYHYSQQFGGAIIVTHSNVNIRQSIFENNGAEYLDYGGAIILFAEQQSVITMDKLKQLHQQQCSEWNNLYLNSCSNITELNCLDNRGAYF